MGKNWRCWAGLMGWLGELFRCMLRSFATRDPFCFIFFGNRIFLFKYHPRFLATKYLELVRDAFCSKMIRL